MNISNNSSNGLSQPTFNIGLVGSVSHGKSSLVKALTGIETFKHSEEKKRGITMKIGYANCKIFKCTKCPEPQCYYPTGSRIKTYGCDKCNSDCENISFFSFIDCPGHESLMSTMLSGTAIMDYAILLIDGSQKCPQQQTIEHLAALEIMGIKKIIIIQNKLDLVDGNKASEQLNDIKNFVKNTCAENAPIIPLSAQKKYNVDVLCEFILKYFGDVQRNVSKPKMNVIRSFDVNKPGADIAAINGGVFGGSLVTGEFRVGDVVEIRPGIVKKNNNGTIEWKPIRTEIISMKTDLDQITTANPGGLIGVCTNLDPSITRSDRMVGHVVGLPEYMPAVHTEISAKCIFMKNTGSGTKIIRPNKGDTLMLNISSRAVYGIVKNIPNKGVYILELKYPCCMDAGEKFSLSSKFDNCWKLVGMAELL